MSSSKVNILSLFPLVLMAFFVLHNQTYILKRVVFVFCLLGVYCDRLFSVLKWMQRPYNRTHTSP